MKVIITGAGGLLGRRLAAEARRTGHEVLGIGRASRPPAGLACDRWLGADLAEPWLVAEHDWSAYRGAAVFHLAADTRVYAAGSDFARDNLRTTATACALAQRTGGRLVFFSSSAVYSGPRTRRPVVALRESDETAPVGHYGRTKRVAEQLIAESGVDAVVLRIFGVLSPRLVEVPDRGNLVQAIVRAANGGGSLAAATGTDGLPMVRDYVLEEDVCACALAALAWKHAAPGPLTVNICTGEATSTEDLIRTAARAGVQPAAVHRAIGPASVNPVMVGDPTLLRKLLGRVPANRTAEFWTQLRPGPVPAA